MMGLNVKKLLKSVAPDLNVEEIINQSAKVPLMLEALIEQGNNQNKALEHIIKKLDTIEEKINKAEELLEVS
ncbi:MAG: hypothetical protein GH144_00035 [Clostridia bacterium]|jgi:hypothetical protein|nr:hypothetical protein [Clostridia bacterium]